MKTYKLTLKHDNGKVNLIVKAETAEQAKQLVMKAENCPPSAIIKTAEQVKRPAKKTALKLAKELDFSHEYELFEYMAESLLNGNKSQCKDLLNSLKQEDKKSAIQYFEENAKESAIYSDAFSFYFSIL